MAVRRGRVSAEARIRRRRHPLRLCSVPPAPSASKARTLEEPGGCNHLRYPLSPPPSSRQDGEAQVHAFHHRSRYETLPPTNAAPPPSLCLSCLDVLSLLLFCCSCNRRSQEPTKEAKVREAGSRVTGGESPTAGARRRSVLLALDSFPSASCNKVVLALVPTELGHRVQLKL